MNNFKIRKIRSRPARKPLSEKTKQNLVTALGLILIILVLYYGGIRITDALRGVRLVELRTDDRGHTNILLAGMAGGENEGKDLTDTLIIASIDHANKHAALLSIPRDLYVETSRGGIRVNRLYEKGGLDFMRNTLSEILAVPIHYSVKIDFSAFEKIIDSIGGVDVFVEQTIDDPQYPKEGTYEFEPFYLAEGEQHLDGKTALKYVRSRHSTSDFDRSRRQHQVLVELKNKARKKGFLGRTGFLKDMYYSLSNNIETNMSVREMLAAAQFGMQWDPKNISSATLNDEPIFYAGFLYTPLRELYGGAFVLLPASDSFDSIRAFAELFFYGPKNLADTQVAILNGTKEIGLAANAKSTLRRFGVNIMRIGNSAMPPSGETMWYFETPEADATVKTLQKLIPGTPSPQIPLIYKNDARFASADVILELGENAKPTLEKLDIFKNVVLLVQPSGTSTKVGTTTAN